MTRLEGSGASRIIQLMKAHGHNESVNVQLGTITAAPPNIKLLIDGDKFELEADDFEVSEYLTKHTRQIKVDGGAIQTLEFQDELEVGDRVVVVSANNDQRYYVIDKAVSYGA